MSLNSPIGKARLDPIAKPPPAHDASDVAAVERDADVRADRALAGQDLGSPLSRRAAPSNGRAFNGLGAGKSLPPALDRRLSRSFGLDLSGLRLHDDAKAQDIAEGMGAEAAISADDIVLGSGARNGSAAEELLAHEVAHYAQAADRADLPKVLRQEAGNGSGIGRAPPKADFERGSGLAPEDSAVTFAFDSADLSGEARASLRAMASNWTGPVHIDLYGYASTEGPGSYNVNLSAHRAVAIQRLLQPLLPPNSTIQVHAHGEIDSFDPPGQNRRVGIDVTEQAQTTATPPRLPGLPQPSPIPPISLGIPPLTLGQPSPDPDRLPPGVAGPELPPPIPPALVPRRFRIPLSTPLTLDPDLAGQFFQFPSLGSGSSGRIDYLPLARSANARGLSLFDIAGRGELEAAYALHRRLYPWIPESGDDVDNWLLGKIVGAMTAQAATERAFEANLSREYPGLNEEMERRAQIDRAMRGEEEPFVIPPITVFELEFDISLGVIKF